MRIALAVGLCLLAFQVSAAPAAKSTKASLGSSASVATARDTLRNRVNQNVVTVMTGAPGGTDLSIVQDLSRILDEGDELRVVPMIGNGPEQAIKDVLYLRGVDMGVTQANLLMHFQKTGELGGDLKSQLVYVAKLFNEEVHLIARTDVADIGALAGKPVNFGEIGSGTAVTARQIFDAIGVKVQEVNFAERDALAKLKSGEIAAMLTVGGKPAQALDRMDKNDGLKLLAIPYAKDLEDSFYPGTLAHADYPQLLAEGESLDTVAVCAVLVSFNLTGDAARTRKLAKFTDRFFSNFDALLEPPRHPKWREVNFAATLEGWRRAPAAQAWIDRAKTMVDSASRQQFDSFLAEASGADGKSISETERASLFRAFLEWNRGQRQVQNN